MVFASIVSILASTAPVAPVAQQLPVHTVSGFSAGASLALFHFLSFSNVTTGVGILGGSPYGCQLIPDSGWGCSGKKANNDPDPTIDWPAYGNSTFLRYLRAREAAGLIDPLSNLARPTRRAYLYSGLKDTDVYPDNAAIHAVRHVVARAAMARSTGDEDEESDPKHADQLLGQAPASSTAS